MGTFIDRRSQQGGKANVNRERFIRRFKKALKRSVDEASSRRRVADHDGESVYLDADSISEPTFHNGSSQGDFDVVQPGNRRYQSGDKVSKPNGSGSGTGKAGNQAGEFEVELTREEFLELFFEGLELPDLVKQSLKDTNVKTRQRAGHTPDGLPANLDVVRSMRGAFGRRTAMKASLRAAIKDLEESDDSGKVEKIHALEERLRHVPFLEEMDLRYKDYEEVYEPATTAVMVCIMDVSGSMGEEERFLARKFFSLLHLFLTTRYTKIILRFVRHDVHADECSEYMFFHTQSMGGTVVSSALVLLDEIIREYGGENYNIYVAQASDGDNWSADSDDCGQILRTLVMQYIQHYFYIEIKDGTAQSLWDVYEGICADHEHFKMARVRSEDEIYAVFREFFARS